MLPKTGLDVEQYLPSVELLPFYCTEGIWLPMSMFIEIHNHASTQTNTRTSHKRAHKHTTRRWLRHVLRAQPKDNNYFENCWSFLKACSNWLWDCLDLKSWQKWKMRSGIFELLWVASDNPVHVVGPSWERSGPREREMWAWRVGRSKTCYFVLLANPKATARFFGWRRLRPLMWWRLCSARKAACQTKVGDHRRKNCHWTCIPWELPLQSACPFTPLVIVAWQLPDWWQSSSLRHQAEPLCEHRSPWSSSQPRKVKSTCFEPAVPQLYTRVWKLRLSWQLPFWEHATQPCATRPSPRTW